MEVKVTLDPQDWWRLQAAAESAGIKVAQLLRGAIRDAVAVEIPATPEARVEAMSDRGIPDPVIAHRLGMSIEWVREKRRQAGLSPAKFRRELWVDELSRTSNEPPAMSGVSSYTGVAE